ncbi:MAG: macro domain-containing protein [Flavobacteriaceae bacterium]|nr:macro domain-containing protein [Flavobacteriaceae bacterium]
MIQFVEGNILESHASALINTVNTEGVMGKGIALQFKKEFPHNFKVYEKACKEGLLRIGKLLAVRDKSLLGGEKLVINFPTKTSWRKPSEYQYIEEGLKDLVHLIQKENIQSIAIPPLGSGQGGLNWEKVKGLILSHLEGVNAEILIYEPTARIQEKLKKERVKLTPARAMLLAVLYELVRNGEFASEFAAEKIAYFLQKFGAEEEFKLKFESNFYGPYSSKVRHVLYYLNGSYIKGYSAKDKKPFEELEMIMEGESDVIRFLNQPENKKYLQIVERTKRFLEGFYSNFALELLSTVDFIEKEFQLKEESAIREKIENWSDRKKILFSNPSFITIAIKQLQKV